MGRWGTCLISTSNCLIFSDHFRAAKTFNWSVCGCLPRKSIQAYRFVTVYCMNFIIFLRVTLKFFSLSFVPSSHQIMATPLLPTVNHFTSELHKFWHSTPCDYLCSKNIQTYSFVTVYWMNFIIFFLTFLNYFLLVSCPSHQILV